MNLEVTVIVALLTVMGYAGIRLFSVRKDREQSLTEWNEEVWVLEEPTAWGQRLRTLRIQIEPWAFLLSLIMVAAIIFLLCLELFPENLLMAASAGTGTLMFAFFITKDLAGRKIRRFENQLTHAIDLTQAALHGGQNPIQALAVTAEASTGDVRREFAFLVRSLGLGASIEDATARMRRRFSCDGVRLFCQVMLIKSHSGGDLCELLDTVNRIIRDKVKFRIRMAGQLAGVRYASVFVALMPYLVIPFFLWNYPEWLQSLRGHEWGPMFLIGAILSQLFGFFWLRRILRVES